MEEKEINVNENEEKDLSSEEVVKMEEKIETTPLNDTENNEEVLPSKPVEAEQSIEEKEEEALEESEELKEEINEDKNIELLNINKEEKKSVKKEAVKEKKEFVFNEKENEYISRKTLNKVIIGGIIFALLLSSISAGLAVWIASKKTVQNVVIYQQSENGNNTSTTVNTVVTNDITDIIEKISEEVVEVYTEAVSYNSFYGQYVSSGAGSGVVYSKDGYILTNNHVIDGASSIKVKTNDGTEYEATLIATDAVSDIAILKIDADNLKAAVIGSSSSLKVGENCIAIGNPLGTLGGSVTTGIISALSRNITIDGQEMTLLQTNTAINPGNSGGGLFNYNGELIGIVNAKSSGSDIEGIGFAIPIDYVKDIAEQLLTNGYVEGRPSIGISCTSIESIQQAWNYGVSSYGVYINEVVGENAKEAGLEAGDLIVALNGTTISNYEGLKSALNKYSAGDEVTITVLRGRSQVDIKVVLEQKTN